jgi:hypothetical protein
MWLAFRKAIILNQKYNGTICPHVLVMVRAIQTIYKQNKGIKIESQCNPAARFITFCVKKFS